MSIDLKVYDNGDHTCLVWLPNDENLFRIAAASPLRKSATGSSLTTATTKRTTHITTLICTSREW